MQLGILSSAPKCYSTTRLVNAAKEQGHAVKVLNPLKCSVELKAHGPALYYQSKPIPSLDAVIARIGPSVTAFGAAIVGQLEVLRVFVANDSASILAAGDKLRNLQVMIDHSVPVPDSVLVHDRNDLIPAIDRVGGVPVMLTLMMGSRITAVIHADSIQVASSVAQAFRSDRHVVIVQRADAVKKFRRTRGIVVGDEVVAAVQFGAQVTSARAITPDNLMRETAIRVAEVFGLQIAGIDMLETDQGPLVTGVCSSPGLKRIEQSTNVDVAARVINFMAAKIDFPKATMDTSEKVRWAHLL